ncbi:dolichyl-P-Man:Man(5)GlcNAc(2)-PP-dolichol alpha-1,3-mannosyltransferase [Coccidioides immitis]|nr:dolichyl-P-Man:Man(5)GlcNAc(2)-PP-dolichol alpha-1,3-mannosyltransferase [Coccidioides immitis]
MELCRLCIDLCTNPKHSKWICPLLLLAESVLCSLIVWKIPYTEIDWSTYMQQVSIFLSGERDYTLIKGSTGPLVYPAGHVYAFSLLYSVTDEGRDIAFGQIIFAGLYIVALALVMATYWSAGAPPYIYPLLVLSKRLHSIFMLRMFNDGIATLLLWATIYMLQKRRWSTAVMLWSAGVSVKMTLLLVAPALAVILTLAVGFPSALGLGILSLLVQLLIAIPFLQKSPVGYFARAFEFTRQFLFKWTVNWRFVGEEIFLSRSFSLTLLVVHLSLLALFLGFSWLHPSRKSLTQIARDILQGKNTRYTLTTNFITKTMLTSLVIGFLCARSLHYQFFSYLAWASPLLLWESGLRPLYIFALCLIQEYAWNVYPSTSLSSMAVVMALASQVLAPALN